MHAVFLARIFSQDQDLSTRSLLRYREPRDCEERLRSSVMSWCKNSSFLSNYPPRSIYLSSSIRLPSNCLAKFHLNPHSREGETLALLSERLFVRRVYLFKADSLGMTSLCILPDPDQPFLIARAPSRSERGAAPPFSPLAYLRQGCIKREFMQCSRDKSRPIRRARISPRAYKAAGGGRGDEGEV